jgi:TRAP-type C4-dicarboxylate transport system substrate-binding protein
MDRRNVISTGAALAVLAIGVSFGAPAAAQQKLVLKATDVHPLGYPTVEAVVRMGKKLEALSITHLSRSMKPL